MLLGAGSFALATGQGGLDVTLVFGSANGAAAAADKLKAELGEIVGSGVLPPLLAKILKAVLVAASGERVKLSLAMAEADLLALLQLI